jgi:hypothetical protein
MVSP